MTKIKELAIGKGIRGRGDGGGDEGRSGEGAKESKTNVASAASAQKTQCLLLCGVCLAASSRGWPQHRGMNLRQRFLCVLFCLFVLLCVLPTRSRDAYSLQMEEERRE